MKPWTTRIAARSPEQGRKESRAPHSRNPSPRLAGAVSALLALGFSHAASADEPDGEGDYVESIAFEEVLPNAPGEWDFRVSLEASREPSEGTIQPTSFAVPRGQIFFGIVERLGGELEIPLSLRLAGNESVFGLGDVGLGLKYHFLGQRGLAPSNLTGMLEVHFPTGSQDRQLGDGKTELEMSLGWAMSYPLFTIQGTLGYSIALPGPAHTLIYNISIAIRLVDGLHAFGEFLADTALAELETRFSAGPGIKYDLSGEIFVAVATLIGVTTATDPCRAIVQVQYGF